MGKLVRVDTPLSARHECRKRRAKLDGSLYRRLLSVLSLPLGSIPFNHRLDIIGRGTGPASYKVGFS